MKRRDYQGPCAPVCAAEIAEAERMVLAGARVRAIARRFGWDARTAHRIVDPVRQRMATAAQRDALMQFAREAVELAQQQRGRGQRNG